MKFEELPDWAKTKALSNYSDPEYVWYDFIVDCWIEKLESLGFMRPDIYFSGFYSQGDGACFDCKSIDNEKVLSALFYCGGEPDLLSEVFSMLSLTEAWADALRIKGDWLPELQVLKHHSGNYCHEHTRYVNVEYNEYFENTSLIFCQMVEEFRISLCKQIYHDLEKCYEDITSEEHFITVCRENEYEFDEEGNLV